VNLERKKIEKEYHDRRAIGKIDFLFYDTPFLKSLVLDLEKFSLALLGNIKGKRILYYGCGANWILAHKFSQECSSVILIDISQESIKIMNKKIDELNLKNMSAFVMDCENLAFKNDSFDLIFGRAILHHLDLEKSSKEISRILRQGGKAVFLEPLGTNPLINFYRKITPKRRTPSEKPLDFDDISRISKYFREVKHFELTLITNFGIFWNSVLKLPLNKFINYSTLKKIDNFVLDKVKFLRKYCWNVVLLLKK